MPLRETVRILVGTAIASAFVLDSSAFSAEESTTAVLERYKVKLDAVQCHEEEPPGKLRGCEFDSRGVKVHICFLYDARYLFTAKKGWDKTEILKAKVRRVLEESNGVKVDCTFMEPKNAP